MKTWLANLESENNELLKGYLIRQKNHEELLASVREVNKVIQFASRFRRLSFLSSLSSRFCSVYLFLIIIIISSILSLLFSLPLPPSLFPSSSGGKAQARVITEARKAVRENRIDSLQKIIEAGTAEAK